MSDERFYLGNNGTTICDRSQGGSDGFNMLTIFKVVDLLNEQQDHISYWKHKVNGLLWILSQFDEEKVKELLKELENE